MAKRPSGDKLMSQDVGFVSQSVPESNHRRARFATLATGSTLLVLAVTASSLAGDGDDTPTLGRPAELPPIVSTPTQSPATAATKPAALETGNRAVLALPGINAPAGPRPATGVQPIPSPSDETSTDSGLKLDAPVEMKPNPASPTPAARARTSPLVNGARSPRPLTLDSPNEEPLPIDTPVPPRSNLMVRKPATASKPDSDPVPQPQRRGRLFGLLPGPAATSAPVSAPAASSPRSSVSGSVNGTPSVNAAAGRAVVEPALPDFVADAALKKRIEKQARDLVGDKARSIEVRVVGKTAVVQARGVRLFQKKNVRKSLEMIPALSGMKSSIEVVD